MEVDMFSDSAATVKGASYYDERSPRAGESVSSSDRSSSPTPTLQSMTGSMYDGLFDEKHGRKVNSTCPTYSMAADEPEVMRMDEEHTLYKFLFKQLFGDELYVGPPEIVDEILAYSDAEQKRIMDLGTGTAAWAIDMANRYPEAEVVGIDLAPLQPDEDALPINCRLEMDDLNLSLEHYYDSTHLIHIRLLSSGIRDYPGFIDQCAKCLKPGGMLYFCETDFRPYSAPDPKSTYQPLRSRRSLDRSNGQAGDGGQAGNATPTTKKPKKEYISPLVLLLQAIVSALHQKMAHIDAAANLRRWINDHKSLEELTYNELYLPLMQLFPKDTPDGAFSNEIARIVGKDFDAYIDSFKPCLLDFRTEAEINRMKAAALEEIRRPKKQVLVRVVVMSARKK